MINVQAPAAFQNYQTRGSSYNSNASGLITNVSVNDLPDLLSQGFALSSNGMAGAPATITPPAAWGWDYSQLDFTIQYVNGNMVTNLNNARALIPAAVWAAPLAQVFHVDLANGNNANTGISTTRRGDFTNAVKYVTTAMAKANTTGVASMILINGANAPVFNLARGGGTHPTVPMAIIGYGGRVVMTAESAFTATPDPTYPNCYSFPATAIDGVLDWNTTYGPTYTVNGVSYPCPDPWGAPISLYAELTKAASVLACKQTPGTWYCDGTSGYVTRADGAPVTNANTMALAGQAFNNVNATPVSLYMENIDLWGGSNNSIQATYNMVYQNCRLRYSGLTTGGNAISVNSQKGVTLMINCQGDASGADSFNGHLVSGGPGYFLTVNCTGHFTGRNPTQSCNIWTFHDNMVAGDIGGFFTSNAGGTCRIINNSQGYCCGTRALGDRGDLAFGGGEPPTAFQCDNIAAMWLDHVVGAASSYALNNVGTGNMLYRNSSFVQGLVANSSTGYVGPYVS